MRIAVLKENRPHERRVAASVETVEKLTASGFEVVIETGAGVGASLSDSAFLDAGATLAESASAAAKGADLILKIQRPMLKSEGVDEIGYLKKGQMLACHLNALTELETVKALAKKGVTAFAMELMPRISRAQSMDILSSQANISGYKAVLDALEHYDRAVPMMSTAAGRIQPANVMIMGVGVAGLQAIATAKRLGAVVWATDVRPATREQVESLGGKFVAVENEEFEQAQTVGGYAKDMSDDYKRQQAALIAKTLPNMDIVITTALIPGRPAPVLVTEEHVKSMKAGSVIVDLAVEAGGNCPLSEKGAVVTAHGVRIVGHLNWPSRVSTTTSGLFSRNLLNFITLLHNKDVGKLVLDMEDECVSGVTVTHGGEICHKAVAALLKPASKAPKKASGAKVKTTQKKTPTSKRASTKTTSAKKGDA